MMRGEWGMEWKECVYPLTFTGFQGLSGLRLWLSNSFQLLLWIDVMTHFFSTRHPGVPFSPPKAQTGVRLLQDNKTKMLIDEKWIWQQWGTGFGRKRALLSFGRHSNFTQFPPKRSSGHLHSCRSCWRSFGSQEWGSTGSKWMETFPADH